LDELWIDEFIARKLCVNKEDYFNMTLACINDREIIAIKSEKF